MSPDNQDSPLFLSQSNVNSWRRLKLSLFCGCYSVWWMCVLSSLFHSVYIHASLLCECFHKQQQGVKYLFEHMLEGLLRAVRLSVAIHSAS